MQFSKIDAHNHPDWHGHDFDAFLKNMDANSIEKTWLLTWESPPDEYDRQYASCVPSCLSNDALPGPIPFSRCLDYVQRAPDRFVLGYAPDPRRAGSLEKLMAAVEIYGARLCGEVKLRMMLDNFDAIRMFRYCGEMGLPVTVHLDYEFDTGTTYPRPNYWYGGGMDAFERAIRQCPKTVFLGHAPGFWAHISGDDQFDKVPYPKGPVLPGGRVPAMMKAYPNLYCDISAGSGKGALERDLAFAVDFLTQYQDRVLFARDCFSSDHASFIEKLDLSVAIKEKLFFKNAEQLLENGEQKRKRQQTSV